MYEFQKDIKKREGRSALKAEFMESNKQPSDDGLKKCSHGVPLEEWLIYTDDNGKYFWDKQEFYTSRDDCEKCNLAVAVREAMGDAKIPARFRDVAPDMEMGKKLADGKGVLFIGGVGTGKTYALIGALKGYIQQTGKSVKFLTFGQAARAIRDSIGENTYNATYESLAKKWVLVLDDLGTENPSDFMKEFVYNIVNDRYNAMLPILATSNLSSKELAELYSQRVVSRLVEMCEVVKLDGKDKRIK